MMILISYIIPAYNAGLYLEACIDSIYGVDMGRYDREVIVVNDGSTDDTASILAKLKQKYPDLQIYAQPNSGQSVARNVGLRHASGKYVYFVDADDAIDVEGASSFPFECLERESLDLYGVNLNKVCGEEKRPYRRYAPLYNYIFKPARQYMKDRNLQPCPCAYLYRREFLEATGLRFHEGIFHEDEEWAPMAFALAESFVALDVDFYLRYIREESTTTTTDQKKQERKLRDMLTVISTLDSYLKRHPDMRPYMSMKLDYLCVDMLRLLRRQHHQKSFCREMIQALRNMGYFPLHKHSGMKYRIFRLLTRCIY